MNKKSIITFYIKEKNKSRKITTYSKTTEGQKLKNKHIEFVQNNSNVEFQSAYAYIEKRNTKMLMKKHLKSNNFLKLDIKNFFNSLNHELLESNMVKYFNVTKEEANEIILSSTLSNEGLEIGLITSPLLSNIYMLEFDNIIQSILGKEYIYTRYSDDILISHKEDFNYQDVMEKVIRELKKIKLEINEKKVAYKSLRTHTDHIKFLGINIVKGKEENYITISRQFKKETDKTSYFLSKLGKENYIKYIEN